MELVNVCLPKKQKEPSLMLLVPDAFISKRKTISLSQVQQNSIDLSDLNSNEYAEVIRFIEFIKSKK